MALDTYTGLKASVANWLNRADLINQVPDFITLAESQMARNFVKNLRQKIPAPRRLVQRTDAALANGAEYIAVPGDFIGPRDVILTAQDGSGRIIQCDYIRPENLEAKKALKYQLGSILGLPVLCPRWYTVVGGELQFFPVADQAYSVELTYLCRPTALSDGNASNWVLANFPDAYLYGALAQSAPFLKEDARLATWVSLFTAACNDICNSDPMPTNKVTLRTDVPVGRDVLWRNGLGGPQ